MTRYYITCTWDDWPEGGSYGTIVMAEDPETALGLAHREMASIRTETGYCRHCGEDTDSEVDAFCADCLERIEAGETLADTGAAIERFIRDYGGEWQTVDLFDIDEFIAMHALPPAIPTPVHGGRDPDGLNRWREMRGFELTRDLMRMAGTRHEDASCDAITCLLHAIHAMGRDVANEFSLAVERFNAQTSDGVDPV